MHFLTIVMALKKEHIPMLLKPYDENESYKYTYYDCNCIYNSPDKETPDPNCIFCNGTGKVLEPCCDSSAHWDWYEDNQAEGRWADYVLPWTPEDVDPDQGIAFAIVTPDRGWLERSKEEDEEHWSDTYWEAFNEAIKKGYQPFIVDCHE